MDYDLYIKVENGLPINHPAFKINLVDVFGAVPEDWEPFIRVPNPIFTDKTVVLEHPDPVYRKIDGVWQDVWYTRPKTAEELAADKEAILAPIREQWANRPYAHNFTAWVLNEEKLVYEPPIPRPNNGGFYRWYGAENRWRVAEPFPKDGKKYYFDFDNWANVEITDV